LRDVKWENFVVSVARIVFDSGPVSDETPSILKARLREKFRSEACVGDSAPVREAVADWIRRHPQIHTIATFAALPDEVDLAELVMTFPEKRWLFPRVDGDQVRFHASTNLAQDLARGAFGILEPRADLPVVPISEIDAFLCPGMAFDQKGGRLGRGKGFYDRLLSMARSDAHKIGVAFPSQIVPDTYREAHDIIMDEIIF
jgi:5-formyltetrahydrofolate cyclo-ligase